MSEVFNRLYIDDENVFVSGVLDDDTSRLDVTCFNDYSPDKSKTYFTKRLSSNVDTLVVGLVFYNENDVELKRSLKSIGQQISEVKDLCSSQVVIVGDGVKQMHPTTHALLKSMFVKCERDEVMWNDMINDLLSCEHLSKDQNYKTYVIQRYVKEQDRLCCVKIDDDYQYVVTLILKSENRRKHNSQEWILNSFAKECFETELNDLNRMYHNRYVLMTDCGTLFENDCIYLLLKYMKDNQECVGVTARQRVMTSKEQNEDDERWYSFSKYLRIVQLADYELTYATYTGAFGGIGCLPVLPGPCALFRYSGLLSKCNDDILNESHTALDYYNNFVSVPIDKTNVLIENVKLAEDRLPSIAVVLFGSKDSRTAWEGKATFKFQSESTLESLFLQRRRWINGAMSAYIWYGIISNILILRSKIAIHRKILLLFLYWTQILNYLLSSCSYGILSGSLYISLLTIFHIDYRYCMIIPIVYLSVLITHIIVHKYCVFDKIFTHIVMVLNAISFGFVLGTFVYSIIVLKFNTLFTSASVNESIILVCALVLFLLPIVISILSLNFKSTLYILLSYIPYLLFVPTLNGTLMLYSLARYSDITWGNRVSDIKSSFVKSSDEERTFLKKRMSIIATIILTIIILINVALLVLFIIFRSNLYFISIIMLIVTSVFIIPCVLAMMYMIYNHITCKTCKRIK